MSKPQFLLGSMLIWYAMIFFFLYVTLSVLRGHPFWQCLGWRKIQSFNSGPPKSPLFFFLAGAGLSLLVAVLSSRLNAPENTPMEELFKHRETALLFIAMAVLVAPLVEETLFNERRNQHSHCDEEQSCLTMLEQLLHGSIFRSV